MTRIRTIPPEEADETLAAAYAKVATPGGPIANILQAQSLHPRALGAHLELYKAIVFAPSPLSRAERELVAVAVSAANDCEY